MAIRVRAWKAEVRTPQRFDFVQDLLAYHLDLQLLDIRPTLRLGYYLGYVFSFLLAFPRLLLKRFDYLFLENPYLVVFAPIAKLKRKRVVAEYVDYYPANLDRLRRQRFLRYQVAKVLCRVAHHFVDVIVVESETAVRTLERWGVPRSKVQVIPVGVDVQAMVYDPAGRQRVRQTSDFGPTTTVVGYLGKMVDYYHIDEVLRAVREAFGTGGELACLLVGDGPDRPRLQSLAEELGVRAVFPGSVPHKDVPAYYSAIDVFVFPLNALAIKLGELMAVGTPLVVPRGMAEDWVTDGVDGLVARSNRGPDLAQALERFSHLTPEERQSLVTNEQRFAQQNLALHSVVRKYLQTIQGLV